MKSVSIADDASLLNIGSSAFQGCSSLESFNFPINLESIGGWAFAPSQYDSYWESDGSYTYRPYYDYAGGYDEYGNYYEYQQYRYANRLNSIDLSNCRMLKRIGSYAFFASPANEINLSDLVSLESIEEGAFSYIQNAKNFEISIADAVVTLGNKAFANSSLKNISFQNTSLLKNIGDGVFQGCYALQAINLPSSLENISNNAFNGCNALRSVSLAIDGNLKSIGTYAFNNCNALGLLTIPATVANIGSNAFNFGTSKAVLVFASTDPRRYDPNMFSNLGANDNVRVKIPSSALSTYQAKYPDMTFISTDVERIELNLSELAAAVNNDYQFEAAIFPEGAINAIQWSSSDETIATIDANGKMHAITEGDVLITATALDGSGVQASCAVNVTYVDMEAIQLAQASYWLRNGNTGKVSITTTPSNASDRTVTYTTSNPDIATVDEYGVVTAHAIGTCEITATSVSTPDVSATAEIEVRAYKPAQWIVEDKNEDGYFTIQDAETGSFMTLNYGYYDYDNYDWFEGDYSHGNVVMSEYGEGNTDSEWILYDRGVKATIIQPGVSYLLKPRRFEGKNEYYIWTEGSNMSVLRYSGWYDMNPSQVEFKAGLNCAMYMALDNSLIQQETNPNVALGKYNVFVNDDAEWNFRVSNTLQNPESLSTEMTSYKSSNPDAVMPEYVEYDGQMLPVTSFKSTTEERRYYDEYGGEHYTYVESFSGFEDITSLSLPSTLSYIGGYPTNGSFRLNSITVSASNPYYSSDNGVLLSKDASKFVLFPKGIVGSYTVPSTIKNISSGIFSNSSLSKVTLPSTLQSIDQYAFNSAISEINIEGTDPDQLISLISTNSFNDDTFFNVDDAVAAAYKAAPVWSDMADRIFAKSDYHKEVTLTAMASSPALLAAIGGDKVANQIVSLKISGTMNGYDIMMLRNKMDNLRYLDLGEVDIVDNDGGYEYYTGYHTTENTIPSRSFYGLSNIRSIKLPQSITEIQAEAFTGCNNLVEVSYMPESCLKIGDYAFARCNQLNNIIIGAGVEEIGTGAFIESGLQSATIGNNVKTLGESAFARCTNLRDVNIGNSLKYIQRGAFYECTSLKSVTLPESLRYIYGDDNDSPSFSYYYADWYGGYYYYCNAGAFTNCYNLETLNIPYGLEYIGGNSFRNCSSLKELMLPESVKTISRYAFNGCSGLDAVHVSSLMERIDDYAFTNCNLKDVFAYGVSPVSINQNTFNYRGVTLHAPDNSFYTYYLNTQWSQFPTIEMFEPVYSNWYTYRGTDVTIDVENYPIRNKDAHGANGSMQPGSGLIFVGNGTQLVDNMVLNWGHGDNYPAVISNDNLNVETLKFLMNVNPGTWYFFCFPFDIDLDKIEMDSKWVWRYYDSQERANNGYGGWKDVTDHVLHANQGYIFQSRDAGTLNIPVSNPVFGDPDKYLELKTYSSQTSQVQDASWNFMGNPTLSYYNIAHLAEAQFEAPITVWDTQNNTYEAIMPGDDDYSFHPFEAYFVQKPEGINEMDFMGENRETYTESQKTLMKARRARASMPIDEKRLIVNLTLTNDLLTDKTRIVFNDEKSTDYELGCDASKFFSNDAPQIYTIERQDVKYAINERPKSDLKVKIGYTVPTGGIYYISAPRMDLTLALKDMETGRIHSFTENGDYEFQSEAGEFNERFLLIADPFSTDLEGLKSGAFALEVIEGGINLRGINGETAYIYNTGGQLMASADENGFIEVPAGTYVVKMGEKSRKVVVK